MVSPAEIVIFDRRQAKQKQLLWSPWIWRFIFFGVPIIIVWGILGVYVPILFEEVKLQARSTSANFRAAFPKGVLIPSLSLQTIPSWVNGFSMEIPKLGIQESIVENVDAGNKDTYIAALTKGIAHAGGTGLPGNPGVQYYFAHSSGLPFWGGRVVTFATLYRLEKGDEVIMYRNDQKYRYIVSEKKVVNPDDINLLSSTENEEKVVLQTCWPLGTSLQRLNVVAYPIK